MNFYSLIRLNRTLKNHRIKFLGLWFLYSINRRFLGVYFDPVMACNLRCKMCYFTDQEYVKKLKGIFPEEDLNRWAAAILPRALKLQIGCGTEPTLYKALPSIVRLGKKYKVPYISLTTNANLLTKHLIEELVASGLNEFTISLHGVEKEEYENFMGKASYEKFHEALSQIQLIKTKHPHLILRVNYTFNKDNFYSLPKFFSIYGNYSIDYLQLRPMKSMGDTEYKETDLETISKDYNKIMQQLVEESKQYNTHILANLLYENLQNQTNTASYIHKFTYCYISPNYFWRDDFNWKNEDFNSYSNRTHFGRKIWKNIFTSENNMKKEEIKESLNYDLY